MGRRQEGVVVSLVHGRNDGDQLKRLPAQSCKGMPGNGARVAMTRVGGHNCQGLPGGLRELRSFQKCIHTLSQAFGIARVPLPGDGRRTGVCG